MIKSRWRSWLMGTVAGLATGCSSNVNPEGPTPPVQNRAELLTFKGNNACQDLETYLEDTAVLQMRTQLEAQRDQVPGWGWWGGGWGGRGFEGDFAPQAGAANDTKSAAPTQYTTTNNQVAGVDEADFVKNDGTRIFVLSGNQLYASKSWPAAELSLKGKIKIEGWPREMFLDGQDKAVVFSTVWQRYPLQPDLGFACDSLRCGYSYSNTTKLTVLDVSDLGNLKVISEYYLPGYYQSARKVGSSVRMVMTDSFRFPQSVKFWPEWEEGLFEPANKGKLAKKYDAMISANEQLIRSQVLSDWLPPGTAVLEGKARVMPQDCASFSKVNAPTRLGVVTVATLDLSKPSAPSLDRNSILGESGEIYASQDNLYVATRHWWWWPQPGQKDTTYVHKFDISKPDQARYVASGTIDGHIVDQFSMDENTQGYFRVATTLSTRVLDPLQPNNWWGRLETTNRLTVTAEKEGRLNVVGTSEDIGKGESIMSARFAGDAAYVVTFKQTDPLFTFDLRNPAKPTKVGELKVPGFSSYIHPIDQNHLLTIGTYIPENNTDWRERALQLAIFDVSDLAHPRQTFTQQVGTAYSWSEAQYEHKAFNYFPAKKLLAIPFSDWSYNTTGADDYWSSFISELRVFEVDVDKGFTVKGAVSMKDLFQVQQYYGWTYYWTPQVRRSVMADDFVYSISDAGLRVAHISNLRLPLATAYFDRYVEQY